MAPQSGHVSNSCGLWRLPLQPRCVVSIQQRRSDSLSSSNPGTQTGPFPNSPPGAFSGWKPTDSLTELTTNDTVAARPAHWSDASRSSILRSRAQLYAKKKYHSPRVNRYDEPFALRCGVCHPSAPAKPMIISARHTRLTASGSATLASKAKKRRTVGYFSRFTLLAPTGTS